MFRFGFTSLAFSDGTEVQVPPEGVVVLVGPNNAGKSAALRELVQHISILPYQQPPIPHVVTGVNLRREGTRDDLEQWLTTHSFTVQRQDGRYFQRPGVNTRWDQLADDWASGQPALPHLAGFLHFFAAADQRLGLIADTSMYDPLTEAPSHPMQVLYAKRDLERRVSDVSFEAFGTRVTLSRVPGSSLRLHLGSTTAEATLPANDEYLAAMRSLPLVQEQGDGVRSFLGIMIALITAQYPVVLVDEPEAFLHPPQARLLGRKLGSELPEQTQVFVATHDGDLLQGLLNSGVDHVTVVRLVRDGGVNRTRVLSSDDVRALWSDPLLRYSNVLQGVFHRGVVASEGDADSRYYAAVLDAIHEQEHRPPHDLLFTQSGGKSRLKTIVRALRAIDIPVAVIVDFDALREEHLLEEIVALQGGDWSRCSEHWHVVTAAVEQLGAAPLRSAVRDEIEGVLRGSEAARLTRDEAERIRAITRVDDAWRQVKRGGLGVLPQGQASEAAALLLAELATTGIFIVPVGELERWCSDVPGHGPEWVSNVLQDRRHEAIDGQAAAFMRGVADYFSARVARAKSEPPSPSEPSMEAPSVGAVT